MSLRNRFLSCAKNTLADNISRARHPYWIALLALAAASIVIRSSCNAIGHERPSGNIKLDYNVFGAGCGLRPEKHSGFVDKSGDVSSGSIFRVSRYPTNTSVDLHPAVAEVARNCRIPSDEPSFGVSHSAMQKTLSPVSSRRSKCSKQKMANGLL